MGKHKKAAPPVRPTGGTAASPASATRPSGLLNKLFATREQTSPLLPDAPPDTAWDEARIRTWVASLSMSEHEQFAAWVEQFASWGTRLKDAHDRSVSAGRALEAERETLQGLLSEESARLAADRAAFADLHEITDVSLVLLVVRCIFAVDGIFLAINRVRLT